MMGHRAELKGGAEYDALSRWRNYYHFKSGTRRWIKRKFSRRQRREARKEMNHD
jgi:hypothetical protein